MPSPSTLGLFSVAALVLLVTPGPAVLYIVTRSVGQGRRAGLVSVLGIHTGSVVHVVAAALGVSAVLARSAHAFRAVKLAGAAYLIYLGLQRLTARRHERPRERGGRRPDLRRVYAQGVVVNVLNPKTALFFLAFLPQFVDPARSAAGLQMIVLGLWFIALGICSDSAYAFAASAVSRRLRPGGRSGRRGDQLCGAAYIGLGVSAAFAGDPARRTAA
ncbi:MAG TPA: LysE family translocator [Acidimicrobiales bacterium]|nr:LysE family translocator [Acidimicrobiales bacterium]